MTDKLIEYFASQRPDRILEPDNLQMPMLIWISDSYPAATTGGLTISLNTTIQSLEAITASQFSEQHPMQG
jgi:hypothetical protein